MIFRGLIDEHRSPSRALVNKNSMINHLLSMQKSEPEYYTDEIIKGHSLVTSVLQANWFSLRYTTFAKRIMLFKPKLASLLLRKDTDQHKWFYFCLKKIRSYAIKHAREASQQKLGNQAIFFQDIWMLHIQFYFLWQYNFADVRNYRVKKKMVYQTQLVFGVWNFHFFFFEYLY